MVIQHNISSLYSLRNMNYNKTQASKSLEKLSSGLKINRSADNAAGLGISEKMRSSIREAKMCQLNVKKGINAANTAEGGLNEISAMMIRARELCVAASNGTYLNEDLAQIEKEVQALFDEINRVTEYTNYNGLKVLRSDNTSTEGLPIVGYDYVENVTSTQDLVEWGLSSMVESPSQIFDRAESATRANVTFTMDSSINLNDAKTLHGKSITINGTRFNFTTDPALVFPTGSTYNISPSSNQTVEEYLNSWINGNSTIRLNYVSAVSANTSTGELTLQAPLTTLNYTVNGLNFAMSNGNGIAYNNRVVLSDELGNLRQVDGNVGAYNRTSDLSYGANATGTFVFTIRDSYDSAAINNLLKNTINVGGQSIQFTTTNEAGKVQISAGMTGAQMQTALVTALQAKGLTVTNQTAGASSGTPPKYNLSITGSINAPGSWSGLYISESTSIVTPGTPGTSPTYDSGSYIVSGMSGVSAIRTQSASSESADIWEITLPNPPSYPNSLTIGGYSIILYDSTTGGRDSSYTFTGGSYSYDVAGKTPAEIQTWLYSTARTAAQNAYSGSANVTMSGNKITLAFRAANQSYSVSASGTSASLSYSKQLTPGTPGTAATYSTNDLRSSSSATYFSRDVSLPMQLAVDGSGNVDIANLSGTGFTYMGNIFEFYSGGNRINTSATSIDISACTTLNDVTAAMQAAVRTRLTSTLGSTIGSTVTATAGPNGQVTLNMTWPTDYSSGSFSYINGNWQYDGMFTSNSDNRLQRNFSGGMNAGKPDTSVDFSSINANNLDELLGTGFRIACASCPNEFVNILFRWDNDTEPVPPNFTLPPPDDNVTIRNYVVELSKVSDPAQIVQNIVAQLTPVMNHYSFVRVDPANPTVLIVEDKRYGDLSDPNQRGSLIPGLFTNFSYNYTKEPIYGTVSGEVEYRDMPIYVSSVSQNYIPLRLPNLSLAALHLYPPKLSIKSAEEANTWLNRIDKAALSVAEVRGVIGSDINRLEKAYNVLGNSEEQTTAAESSIRDLDMAKEMMMLTKNNILTQASQAMLAQANQFPQNILTLLR